MRLIDADALMQELEREVELADDWKTAHEIANVVKYFPTIEPEQKWIPCTERLPEYRELVVFTTRDLRVKIGWRDAILEDGTDDIYKFPLDDSECKDWNIVAWRPLPEPYKEK